MLKKHFLTLLLLTILRGSILAQGTNKPIISEQKPPLDTTNRQLIWGDEFENDSLNAEKWWAQTGTHGDELQYFTPRKANLFVKNGNLTIRAIKENLIDTLPYTSAAVFSSVEFTKGHYFEARCKIPKGKGLWPAFWFWSGRNKHYQEVDVFEFWSDNVNRFSISNHHGKDAFNKNADWRWIEPRDSIGRRIDLSRSFHTYGFDWRADRMDFYFDYQLVLTLNKNLPPTSFPIILNLSVSGDKQKPNRRTVFPADFLVDYVRVYRR